MIDHLLLLFIYYRSDWFTRVGEATIGKECSIYLSQNKCREFSQHFDRFEGSCHLHYDRRYQT